MVEKIIRFLLIALSLALAASFPLRYLIAWFVPEQAEAVGLPPLQTLPASTLTLILILIPLQTLLFFRVVQLIWKVVALFGAGLFLSRDVSRLLLRIGWMLIVVSMIGSVGFFAGLISVVRNGLSISVESVLVQCLNLPLGVLTSGLFALVVAEALARASKLAHDVRFTV